MNAMFEKRKGEDIVRSNVKPQSNADRIRAMSDEELAKFLVDHHRYPCKYCIVCHVECNEGLAQWLKSEAKE